MVGNTLKMDIRGDRTGEKQRRKRRKINGASWLRGQNGGGKLTGTASL